MEIIKILEQDENLRKLNLNLIEAELSKNNFLKVVFACDTVTINDKEKIRSIINKQLNSEFDFELEFISNNSDSTSNISEINIEDLINDFLKSNYNCKAESIMLGEYIEVKLVKLYANTFNCDEVTSNIKALIFDKTKCEKNVRISFIEEDSLQILRLKQKIEISKYLSILDQPIKVSIKNINNLIGNINIDKTFTIGSFKKASDNVYICGKISFYKKMKSKPKEVDGKIIEGKEYYSFYLNDGASSIRAYIFTTQKNEQILNQLQDNLDVVCCGDLKEFNGKISYNVKAISNCEFEVIPNPELIVPEPEKYLTVIPEQYIETSQLSLFAQLESSLVNDFLKNNSFVVFDFETTGLDHETDAITELGAVKVVNGKIVETFSTFVNPKIPIPEKITQLTHITDDMVKNAPVIEDVLMDFYKFCYNSSLVAHNIDFDFKFLKFNARKIGVTFTNKQFDTLILAREYIKGLKNYKLGTICEYLNVELIDAHRAVNDCLATAKVFIKLSEFIK